MNIPPCLFFSRFALVLAVCFVPVQAQASLADWLDQARAQALHEHQRWLQLGHYETSGWRSPTSDISSDDFFLHPQGRTDPEAELLATIEALFAPAAMDEQHAQCRFPARLLWLTRVMDQAPQAMPEVECIGFNGWQGQGDQAIESVSLIAVEGYLRNPSSLYGHVLLKLNQRNPDERNLLATSVNFGVDLPSGESPVRFIARGLFGGYEAVFSHARFHQNSILYGDFQQRDLWDYRLDLTPDQVDMVVAHTWELLGMEFPYYFTGSNCAYRTAAVLDLVLDESLGNRFKPWIMPHDTFNNLMRQRTASGAPLVAEISYFPSRRSVFAAAWDGLNGDERSMVRAFIADPQAARLDDLMRQQDDPAVLLDALIHYYSTDVDIPLDPGLQRTLLSTRLSLPPAEETRVSPEGRARPVHEANYPNMVQLSPGINEHLGAGVEARFRLTYYDMLARPVARPAFTELSMLDIRLWADESSNLTLRRLDVLNLDTLNVSHTGLPGDGGWTTRLRLGYEDTHLACVNCGEFFLEAGRGLAVGRSDRYAFYGLLSARAASGDSGLLSLTPETGLIVQPVPAWSSRVALGYRARVGDDLGEGQPILHLGNRFGTSQRWDVRANARYHEAADVSLGLSVYW